MIAPNAANLLYSPTNWDVTGVRAKTVQNGAYLRFACTSSENIVLHFSTTGLTTTPQIKYRIDGSGWTRTNIASTVTIPLPTENTWDRHVVEMIVVQVGESAPRWTSQGTHVSLTGIDVDTVRPLAERPRRIVFFGDSITAGHIVNGYPYPTEDDASQAWPYLASQHVDAEAGIVGVGGQGWNTAAPSGIPQFDAAYRYHWNGSPERDLAAHCYVVNHGTNDGGLSVTDVTDWLADALPRFTPGAPVLIMRPFGGQHASTLEAAVESYDNPLVRYVDTSGWWDPVDNEQVLHPNGFASIVDLAPRLATVLRQVFAETTPEPIPDPGGGAVEQNYFVNVAGDAVPVSQVALNG